MTDKKVLYDKAEMFLRAIADQPGVALPRLILADWLEEHGLYDEAAGQRWAAREGKYPAGRSVKSPAHNRVWSIVGGWYHEKSSVHVPLDHRLPHVLAYTRITEAPGEDMMLITRGNDLFHCEKVFLEVCGLVDWDASGNPVERSRPSPSHETSAI